MKQALKDNFGYYEPSETEDHNASITEQRRKPDGSQMIRSWVIAWL